MLYSHVCHDSHANRYAHRHDSYAWPISLRNRMTATLMFTCVTWLTWRESVIHVSTSCSVFCAAAPQGLLKRQHNATHTATNTATHCNTHCHTLQRTATHSALQGPLTLSPSLSVGKHTLGDSNSNLNLGSNSISNACARGNEGDEIFEICEVVCLLIFFGWNLRVSMLMCMSIRVMTRNLRGCPPVDFF